MLNSILLLAWGKHWRLPPTTTKINKKQKQNPNHQNCTLGKYICDKVNEIFFNENWMQSDHIGIITIQKEINKKAWWD